MNTKILAIVILLFGVFSADARINPELLKKMKKQGKLSGSRMDCQPAQAQYDLEINNVRARLLTGGDLWWNLQDGRYIVPKPEPGFPEVSAIFASGVWVGGIDPNGALKLAGVTYRSGNNTDYYSGPLDEEGQTNFDVCNDWDRHFVVKGENIRKHIDNYKTSVANNEELDCDLIEDDIKYWPARGNPFFEEQYDFSLPDQNLAEFWDQNGDGSYNPCDGDYPIVAQRGCDVIEIPDEIVYWIFNDNGGPHRLTQATAIQMEVQAQAFAYASQNELNDMTFYRFKLINKASDDIRDCYFGLWVDADLGCSEDDYIGCDVGRSMAYVYNEDDVDGNPGPACPGGVNTYGENIPLLGIDLFRGPRGPKVFCGVDEDGNNILCDPEPGTGEVDTIVELGMTSFSYQNNSGNGAPEPTQDPTIDFEFYNILQGKWKDGTSITYGGTGFNPTSADTTKYVFPDNPNNGAGWSMCSSQLPFDDRRTVQATGPLLLQPGAKNELMFGVVFVPNANYPCPDIEKLQFADDLAQALFDNCFETVVGPDAPDMIGLELDRQLILLLSNDSLLIESNNAKEQYIEEDLMAPPGVDDPYYRFEGYQIYQLADANVTFQELDNIEKARILRQVDIKNGVDDIYNWYPLDDPTSSEPIMVPVREVKGADEGIRHSFNITRDLFAETDLILQNDKDYYYTVIAYAYNNYEQFSSLTNTGQRRPYLSSQRNVKKYKFTPRSLDDIDIPTSYGEEVPVTRIEGVGTSFNALDMADGEVQSILDGTFDGEITYKAGRSPINPTIVNPLGIKDGQYRLEIIGDYNEETSNDLFIEEGAKWRLTNITTGEIISSDKTIEEINEKIIHGKGFSIQVNQSKHPGEQYTEENGALAQEFEYEDATAPKWWDAVPAFTGVEVNNDFLFPFVNLEDEDDPEYKLSTMGDGHFIPMKLSKWQIAQTPFLTPGWHGLQGFAINPSRLRLRLRDINNVDIVFTSDKSKWSKCMVVETAIDDYSNSGFGTIDDQSQFSLRSSPSIDQDGNEIDGVGMSYFPGYAIDVETGKRLNIFFGENTVFRTENDNLASQTYGETINTNNIGSDMIWNPSSDLFTTQNTGAAVGSYLNLVGGQHYVYVTRQEYDGCEAMSEKLTSGGLFNTIDAISFITWTAIPIPKEPLLSLEDGLIPNDLTVKLRATNPFNREIISPDLQAPHVFEAIDGFPLYEFGFENVEVTGIVSTEEQESGILDNISISPNPYYENAINGRNHSDVVRINNLPKGAMVTLYTLEGQFVRRFSEDAGANFKETGATQTLEWNLNDSNGARVPGGIYIAHISVPHLGIHKSLKWIKI